MYCTNCGSSNADSSNFCFSCGNALSQTSNIETKVVNNVSQEDLYKAAIGPKNQSYYLSKFKVFDRGLSIGTWHWPAFLLTFYWFLYRKMWLYAFIYFLITYLIFIPLDIYLTKTGKADNGIVVIVYLIVLLAALIIPPIYADRLYYKHCKKKIAKSLSNKRDTKIQLDEISIKGGTSNVVLYIIFILVFISIIGILAAVAIPAYKDYTLRVSTTQAVNLGKLATTSVTGFYNKYGVFPESLKEAGYEWYSDTNERIIKIDPQTGTIIYTFLKAPLENKSILFVPSLNLQNFVRWKCKSADIESRQLPIDCRP